jgi:hypothetical protein
MMLLLQPDTSPGSPYPEVSSDGFRLPRGVFKAGGPPIAAHLPKNLVFSVTDGEPQMPRLTDYMESIGWIIVSAKLKAVLDQQGANVEYIPMTLRHHGSLHDGYFLANPLRRIKGIDMAASELELNELGMAVTADKLALDESRFAGIPLTILHETSDLVVSPESAENVQAEGCTGCVFVKPETISF